MGRGGEGINTTKSTKSLEGRQITVIHGQAYDITDWGDKHPGGRELINLAVGRDATLLFESYHIRGEVTAKFLKNLPKVDISLLDLARGCAGPFDCPPGDRQYIADKEGEQVASVADTFANPSKSELYTVLKDRIRKEVMAGRGMEQARGYNVFNTVCVVAYYFLSAYLYLCYPSFISSVMLGLAGAWVGFGLQHTANHGALTMSPGWNHLWGLGDDLGCGGSSLIWRYHHQVSHHIYTNVLDKDQDVYSSFPLVRFDDRQEKKWFHAYQYIYAPISFTFLYWSVQIQDIQSMLAKQVQDVRMLGLTDSEVYKFWGGKALHFLVSIIIPLATQSIGAAFWNYFVYVSVGSLVLSWFFIVSHNIEEVKPSNITKEAQSDWARWQIQTSATWGGKVACFFTGGLNYQIEHHLFPGMSHGLYPIIQPIIEEECAKRNIPYHKYDLAGISKAMIDFMHSMGTKDTVVDESGGSKKCN